MITALLRKDIRVNRVAIWGNAIFMLAAYVVVAIAGIFTDGPISSGDVLEGIIGAAYAGLVITAALSAVYGAIAFAQERQDHSANFLALLPVKRGPIVWSKFIVAAGCILGFAAFSFAVILADLEVPNFRGIQFQSMTDELQTFGCGVCVTVMLFGMAWMCSAILESPPIAAGISFGACVFTNMLIAQIVEHVVKPIEFRGNIEFRFCTGISLVMGVCSFAVGTIYYLRRVEP